MTLILNKDNPLATKVQTTDGRKARLLCVDGRSGFGNYPLIVLVTSCLGDGYETLYACDMEGKLINVAAQHKASGELLINAPVEHRVWANVVHSLLATRCPRVHDTFVTKEDADAHAERCGITRVACVEVVFREGDGL